MIGSIAAAFFKKFWKEIFFCLVLLGFGIYYYYNSLVMEKINNQIVTLEQNIKVREEQIKGLKKNIEILDKSAEIFLSTQERITHIHNTYHKNIKKVEKVTEVYKSDPENKELLKAFYDLINSQYKRMK